MNGLQFNCIQCDKPLPPEHAGKCDACAGSHDKMKTAPHCPVCKTALSYWPGSSMAKFNPPCKCKDGGQKGAE